LETFKEHIVISLRQIKLDYFDSFMFFKDKIWIFLFAKLAK
jgi:hypothetical protein